MPAETVDTRVVEAKFDSKQFEQGVDKTVKKLDELKKSLNLKDSEKSVAEIGQKISDASEKATSSLEKLQNRFTSFTGMLKQKLISGIADEIVGGIFKIKNGIEGFVKSLSTGQIGYGMQRYTDILSSVRVLTASGVNQSVAYSTIDRLSDYADQTSYSLDQLVSTMSKFKTAGADIKTAQRMVEGLSNAAASMGVNAQEASRAYLNLQQAYSKGRMTQADWISFESLPMVGEKFNQAIIDAAVKVGTLKKDKNGTYRIDAKGIRKGGNTAGTRMSGVAAKGITAENMGSRLASGWFDKRVMEEVFGSTYYFAEVGIDEVNEIKAEERKIRDKVKQDIAAGRLQEAELDKEVSKRLDEYFQALNKEKLETKKREIDQRKEAAKLDLEAQKGDAKAYAEAKKNYDKLIKDLDKEMGDFEKDNNLTAFAWQTFTAGQEARSFNDVMNTLKDTISRGWAKSFELIFGKLDEAKDFFTDLTESQFAQGIYRIGEFRNLVLEGWRNSGGRDSFLGILKQIDDLFGSIYKKMGLIEDENQKGIFDQDEYNRLLELDHTGYAAKQYKQWAEGMDPFKLAAKELGQRLAILTRNVRDFFDKVKHWLTDADSTGTSRLKRIGNILEGFGKVGSGAFQAIGMGLEFLGDIYTTFKPVFDNLWKAVDEISSKFFDVFDPKTKKDGLDIYQSLSDTFANILKVAEHLAKPLADVVDIVSAVVGFFADMAIATFTSNISFFTDAFALLLEVLGIGSAQQDRGAGILDSIKQGIADLGETLKIWGSAINDFFTSIIADVRTWLGLNDETSAQDAGNIFQNISNWWNNNEAIQSVKQSVDEFFNNAVTFVQELPGKAFDFAAKLPSMIDEFFRGIFYTRQIKVNKGKGPHETSEYEYIATPLKQWLDQAVIDATNFIKNIPAEVAKIPSIIGEFFKGMFYTRQVKVNKGKGPHETSEYEYIATPLKQWIDNAIKDVLAFVKKIPSYLAKIPSLIGEFFKGLFYTKKVERYYGPKGLQSKYVTVKTPLKEWIDNAVKDVKAFIKEIPNYIAKVPSLISEFFNGLFYKRTVSQVTASGTIYKDVATPLKEWIDNALNDISTWISGINLSSILDGIKNIGRTIINGFISIFTGQGDWTVNKAWLITKVAESIDAIRVKAEETWPKVRDWFIDLPNKIANFFKGEDGTKNPSTPIGESFTNFINSIGEWLSSIPDALLEAWKNVEKQSTTIWNSVIGWITGDKSKASDALKSWQIAIVNDARNAGTFDTAEALEKSFKKQNWEENNPIAANLSNFFTNLGTYLLDKIRAIPGDIAAAWETIKKVGSIVWDAIRGTDTNEDGTPKDYGSDLYNGVSRVVGSVAGWIRQKVENLGELVKTGWTNVKTIATIIWDAIAGTNKDANGNIVDYGSDSYNNAAAVIDGIVETIRSWILALPDRIVEGFNFMSELIGRLFNPGAYKQKSILNYISDTSSKNKLTADDITMMLGFGSGSDLSNAAKLAKKSLINTFDRNGYTIIEDIEKYGPYVNPGSESHFKSTVSSEVIRDLNTSNAGRDITGQSLKKTGFFGELWEAFSGMFSSIGPAILEGLNNAFNWVNTKLGEATTFLRGLVDKNMSIDEALKENMEDSENPGKENPMWEAIKNIGKAIWTMLTETIPAFISSAASYIGQQLPNLLSGIFGGNKTKDPTKAKDYVPYGKYINDYYTKQAKEAEKGSSDAAQTMEEVKQNMQKASEEYKVVLAGMTSGGTANPFAFATNANTFSKDGSEKVEEGVDGIGSFMTSIINVFDNIGGALKDKGAQIIFAMVAIAFILNQLNDLVSLRDEVENIGYVAKWTAIEIAIAGIVGIIGYLTYLATAGDETTFERAKQLFSDITTFVKDLSTTLIVLKSLSLGKTIAETVGEFAEDGSVIGSTVKGTLYGVTGAVLAQPLANIISNVSTTLFDTITDSFGSFAVGIDNFIAIIKPAMEKVAALKDVTQAAIETIPIIEKFATTFNSMFIETEKAATTVNEMGKEKEKGAPDVESVTSHYNEIANVFYAIGASIYQFSHGLKEFSTIENPEDELKRVNELFGSNGYLSDSFSEFLSNITEAVWAIYKQGLPTDTDTNAFSNTLRVMSGILDLLATSISGFDATSIESVDKFFEILAAFAGVEIKGKFEWSKILEKNQDLASFGTNLQRFGRNIEAFFGNVAEIRKILGGEDNSIDDSEWISISRTVNFVTKITDKMFEAANKVKSWSDPEKMAAIGNILPQLGLDVINFANNIQSFETTKELNFDYIYKVVQILSMLKDTVDVASIYFSSAPEKFSYIADALIGTDESEGFLKRLSDAGNENVYSFNGLTDFIDTLYKLSYAINTFYSTDNFGKPIYLDGLTKMVSAIDWSTISPDFVAPKITPVLEISDEFKAKADELHALLGTSQDADGRWVNLDYKMNLSGIDLPQLTAINDTLTTINSNLVTIKDNTNSIREIKGDTEVIRSNTDNFRNDLRSIYFEIDGAKLVDKIGHTMDQWLGTEGNLIVRADFNH